MDSFFAQKILEKTKEDYRKIAHEFSKTRQTLWPELKDLAQYVKDQDKVLDVGCGNGRLYQLFRERPINYLGIDNCQELIKEAQENFKNKKLFQLMEALDLSFPQDSFDVVFCLALLSHLPSYELRLKLLNNIHRVLKTNGLFILTVWNLWQFTLRRKSWWRFTLDKWLNSPTAYQAKYGFDKKDLGRKDVLTLWNAREGVQAVLYYYAFTLKELEKLVKEAGFSLGISYHVRQGKKTNWFKGYNLVILAQKC